MIIIRMIICENAYIQKEEVFYYGNRSAIGQYFHTASYLAGTYSYKRVFCRSRDGCGFCNKNKIHRLKEQGNKKAALIERLMEGSTAFLSAIQLIVTLAGFLSSAVAATGISGILAVKMNRWGIPGSKIAAVVVITLILVYVNLVFGGTDPPKRMALQNAEKILVYPALAWFILYPVS